MARELALFMVPFLFSLCFHEYAHGWVARLRGDRTAEVMGRLTMNPMAHADMLGTFILPAIGIITGGPILGWAKPVPVTERNLKNPRTDMFWVAAAGPASNLLLATVCMFIFVYLDLNIGLKPQAATIFARIVQLNLVLAIFNLIPVHPLDGGKIIARFIPIAWDRKMEEHQGMISMALFVLMFAGVLPALITPPLRFSYNFLASLAGSVLS